jgi:hypothetical protein
VADHPSEE